MNLNKMFKDENKNNPELKDKNQLLDNSENELNDEELDMAAGGTAKDRALAGNRSRVRCPQS